MQSNSGRFAELPSIPHMATTMSAESFPSDASAAGSDARDLLSAVSAIAKTVATSHAADVDAKSRFPRETIDALKNAKVLSAAIPRELGGAGLGMRELAALCSTLSQACGSSGMVLAMHFIQIACIARHGMESAFFRQYMKDLVKHQYLLASIT